jgi:hypothetical protein
MGGARGGASDQSGRCVFSGAYAIRCGAVASARIEEECHRSCHGERHDDRLTRFRVQYRYDMHGKSGLPDLTPQLSVGHCSGLGATFADGGPLTGWSQMCLLCLLWILSRSWLASVCVVLLLCSPGSVVECCRMCMGVLREGKSHAPTPTGGCSSHGATVAALYFGITP